MEKVRVPLASVSPSGQNPRRDFGDVGALARSIAATGGQPVSPIVVARDGGRYRIVDGERRYRAMLELGAEECEALVCDGWGEAEEAVAMMATDDKKGLTDEERARGFQGMLMLGVDDETASGASGVGVERVRAIRRIASEVPEQATMDAMIAASEFDDPADRAEVLSSPDPSLAAARVRRRMRDDESFAAVREALDGCGLPVEWPAGDAPSVWSPGAMREAGVAFAFDAAGARAAAARARELAASRPGCSLRAWRDGRGARVFRVLGGDEGPGPEEVADGLRRASAAAVAEAVSSVATWLSGLGSVPRDLASLVRAGRSPWRPSEALGVGDDPSDARLAAVMDSDPSVYEAVSYLASRSLRFGIRSYDGSYDDEAARWLDDLMDAAADSGWRDAGLEAIGEELGAWLDSGAGGGAS